MDRRAVLAMMLAGVAPGAIAGVAQAATPPRDRFFTTSDGVRLHYIEAGPPVPRTQGAKAPGAHTIVLVPGWTMPAWIWSRQIAAFSPHYRVIAFDPRGQGESQIPITGYDQNRRGDDIAELLAVLGGGPVLLVGWSLGVLDVLACTRRHGEGRIAGLVLIDNSVGENPPPVASHVPPRPGPKLPRAVSMRRFVGGMFAHPQPAAWLDRLTRAALRVPEPAAEALLAYPVPRTYWKDAIYAVHRPILYVVRPRFEGQAENLARHHPDAETVVLNGVGHALFIDDAAGFDRLLGGFIRRRVWR